MHELRRVAYLEAMGIDTYVSRRQVEGAAVTRRLAIVRSRAAAGAEALPLIESGPAPANPVIARPHIPKLEFSAKDSKPSAAQPAAEAASPSATAPVPPFSLAALVAADWLWLEELPGMPLTREQVQLIRAIALALATETGRVRAGATPPAVQQSQFNWPIHTNQQLDLGPEAARSAVAGFIRRKLEEHGCRGLVLLGRDCAARVPLAQLDCAQVVHTVSSAEMLQNGLLKKQAWLDLRSLIGRR